MIYFRRRRTIFAVTWYPQFPVQTGPSPGSALDLPGQTRLGTVLLQGRAEGTRRSRAQKSAGLHRHEPDRLEPRASDTSGELPVIRDE